MIVTMFSKYIVYIYRRITLNNLSFEPQNVNSGPISLPVQLTSITLSVILIT